MHNIPIQFLLCRFHSQHGRMSKHKIVDQRIHELTSVCLISKKLLTIEHIS
jgi:hypothetical protein